MPQSKQQSHFRSVGKKRLFHVKSQGYLTVFIITQIFQKYKRNIFYYILKYCYIILHLRNLALQTRQTLFSMRPRPQS